MSLESLLFLIAPKRENSLARNFDFFSLSLTLGLVTSASSQTLHKLRIRLSALIQSKSSVSREYGARIITKLVRLDWNSTSSHGGIWIKLLVPLIAVKFLLISR